MKRLAFNISTSVSLVLMLAVAGLWVRSYWLADGWAADVVGDRLIYLVSSRGVVMLEVSNSLIISSIIHRGHYSWPSVSPGFMQSWYGGADYAGLGFGFWSRRSSLNDLRLIIPFWFPALFVHLRRLMLRIPARRMALISRMLAWASFVYFPVLTFVIAAAMGFFEDLQVDEDGLVGWVLKLLLMPLVFILGALTAVAGVYRLSLRRVIRQRRLLDEPLPPI